MPAKGTSRTKFSYMTAARGFSPQLSYLKESTTQEAYTMPGEQPGSEYKGPGPVLYSGKGGGNKNKTKSSQTGLNAYPTKSPRSLITLSRNYLQLCAAQDAKLPE